MQLDRQEKYICKIIFYYLGFHLFSETLKYRNLRNYFPVKFETTYFFILTIVPLRISLDSKQVMKDLCEEYQQNLISKESYWLP